MHAHAHTDEHTLLLLCCRSMCAASETAPKIRECLQTSLDWDYLCRRMRQHGIGPLVYHSLKAFRDNAAPPLAVLENLKKICMTTLIVNRKLLDTYASLRDAFHAEQISLIPYKGIAFLDSLYPSLDLRPMADLDILIKKEDVPRATTLLERMGFQYMPHNILFRNRHFHLTFIRQRKEFPLVIELHWHVDFLGSPFALRIEDIWDRARHTGACPHVFAMDIHDELLLNFYHLLRDPAQDKVIPLKNCVDIALMIQRHRIDIDWRILRQRAEDYMLLRLVDLGVALLEHLSLVAGSELLSNKQAGSVPFVLVQKLVSEKVFPDMNHEVFLPEGLLVQTPKGIAVGLNVRGIFKTVAYHLVNEYIHRDSFAAYLRKIIADFQDAIKNYFAIVRAMLFNRQLFSLVKEKKIRRAHSLRSIEKWLQDKG